ncbi:MAG TPA: hypothetical protein IAC04_04205 [Candidatus Coprenecus stercoravium]|uniref:DUF3859 domain-containing protein n=1 Tax=Candidatus Coprenecus stercoravium TaxID=2840735 RepID=A0A9D2GRJ9_9BACT|nr:hypothetical protein [Candidatus Coprenecus stercoravium]
MSLRITTAAILTAWLCLAASCSSAPVFTTFPDKTGKQASFSLDMSDSTAVYALDLIGRFPKGRTQSRVALRIDITSPSGLKAGEEISLPAEYHSVKNAVCKQGDGRMETAATPTHYDISWRYRDNIRPSEYGIWTLTVSVPDKDDNILGTGVRLHKIQ